MSETPWTCQELLGRYHSKHCYSVWGSAGRIMKTSVTDDNDCQQRVEHPALTLFQTLLQTINVLLFILLLSVFIFKFKKTELSISETLDL